MYAPQTCPTATLVQVASRRGRIEQAFQVAKGQVGLDTYEVRTAHGWARHVTLALWGLALLSRVRAHAAALPPPPKTGPRRRTACPRARGRAAAGAWRRSAGGGGAWCSRYPPPRPRSWPGHSGAASIHGWPCAVTGNAGRPSSLIYNCSIRGVFVAGRERKGPPRPFLVDHPVQLEAKKPAHGGLASLGDPRKDLVPSDASVVADGPWRRINDTEAHAGSIAACQVRVPRHPYWGHQGHKAHITGQTGKLGPADGSGACHSTGSPDSRSGESASGAS